MGDHVATTVKATQAAHPWRATVRTVFQAVVALAAAAPFLYQAFTMQDPAAAAGGAGTFLSTCVGITRVMNLPIVDAFIRAYLPWLAPDNGTAAGTQEG